MPKHTADEYASLPSAKRQTTLTIYGALSVRRLETPKPRTATTQKTFHRQTKLDFGNATQITMSPLRLSTVLSDLSTRDRYKNVNVEHAYQQWWQDLTAGARTVIKAVEAGIPITKQLLLSIGGITRDLRSAGWYLCVVEDDHYQDYFRAYVGQSENVSSRVQQHSDLCQKDPTKTPAANKLLYHIWRKEGRQAKFMHLGEQRSFVKSDIASSLQLNIGEQLLAEKLQTLQFATLRRILPSSAIQEPAFGLNVALPVHQGCKSSSKAQEDGAEAASDFLVLSKASDLEVRDYYEKNHHKFTAEQQQKGRQTMALTQHVQQIYGARQGKQAKTSELTRGPQTEEEKVVEIQCMKCGSEQSRHFDPAPQYEIATNGYVARRAACVSCPRLASAPTKSAREIMVPADGSAFVRWDWLGKSKNREDPRWAHKRGSI